MAKDIANGIVRGRGVTKPAQATAAVGLVLFGPNVEPIYFNSEALRIFAYPHKPAKNNQLNGMVEKLRPLVAQQLSNPSSPSLTELLSGRRRYRCRIFLLEHGAQGKSQPSVALTVERHGNRGEVFDILEEEFRLTTRERQAVELLAEGLTSKEIAVRMKISPNTVKAFLRLVMIKMGVTTRSGIVGKVVEAGRYGFGRVASG
ncbi:MAG TPA: LuxR C-terminal-related transcriptional regulator [Terriglobales bacterium]|jgi:DNA-binding CsgD family transcriptional regulator|nr:LuxR C-terminal-related transcriptional regulator [Terriglobales bacterium]